MSFLSSRQAEGNTLPEYVEEEFFSYLKCGIPAYGFLRLVCVGCKEEKIVAFSCKKRGFCASCAVRRKSETALHLTENVLPHIPYRQFVVTFPMALRFWLHTNKKLFKTVHKIITTCLHDHYKRRALTLGIKEPQAGTISFTQRWGSALNLNPHLHILTADGVYSGEDPQWHSITDLTDKMVEDLITQISTRIIRHLKRSVKKLIEYIARGPLSNKRLEITGNGKIRLELKTPYRDGTSHIEFTKSEVLERLAAIIPPPRAHLVRWGGFFASASKIRPLIVLKPKKKKGFDFTGDEDKPKNYSWAKLLSKVFKIDVLTCSCGGEYKPVAALQNPNEIKPYLLHVGIDSDPPHVKQPRQGSLCFDDSQYIDDVPTIELR